MELIKDHLVKLLNPEVHSLVGAAVSTVPVDGLDLGIAIALDGEVVLASVGEVALVVAAKVDHAGAVGGVAGVRDGELDRENSLLDDVEVLEGRGDGVPAGERDGAGVGGGADCFFVSWPVEGVLVSTYRWRSRSCW